MPEFGHRLASPAETDPFASIRAERKEEAPAAPGDAATSDEPNPVLAWITAAWVVLLTVACALAGLRLRDWSTFDRGLREGALFWTPMFSGYLVLAYACIPVGAAVLIKLSRRRGAWFAALMVISGAALACLWISARAGYAITPSHVVIAFAEPGRPLAYATLEPADRFGARTCFSSKGHSSLIYRVSYTEDPRPGAIDGVFGRYTGDATANRLDIAGGLNRADVGAWVDAMRAANAPTVDQAWAADPASRWREPTSPARQAGFERCLAAYDAVLTEDQRRTLRTLLEP